MIRQVVGTPLSSREIGELRRVNTRDYRDLIATIDALKENPNAKIPDGRAAGDLANPLRARLADG